MIPKLIAVKRKGKVNAAISASLMKKSPLKPDSLKECISKIIIKGTDHTANLPQAKKYFLGKKNIGAKTTDSVEKTKKADSTKMSKLLKQERLSTPQNILDKKSHPK